MSANSPTKQNRNAPAYKIHWHVLLVHFPLSFFGAAFLFQILHVFIFTYCFELATIVSLLIGAIMIIPTILTGWFTWKNAYKKAKMVLFQRKIVIAFVMAPLSISLIVWRFFFFGFGYFAEIMSPQHWLFLAGNFFLIVGAVLEGYYGSSLHHR